MSDHQDTNLDGMLQQATDALRQTTVPDGPSPEDVTKLVATLEKAAMQSNTCTPKKRGFAMKPITKMAVAATILLALGSFTVWTLSSGAFTSIAFANVADALDSLRSATFDVTTEVKTEGKGEKGQPFATMTGKGFFLTPSLQRMEMDLVAGPANIKINQVLIIDGQAAKSIILLPDQKFAISMNMEKMKEDMMKSANGAPPDVFEMVRRLVREGSSRIDEKAERLGKKEIDGRMAVGFRVRANMMDMTLWADPETAWPLHIEIVIGMMNGSRIVMNNFRYDIDLDPLLFSLEPPAGYSTQAVEMTTPVEEDLLRTLRMLAEHDKGLFPTKLGMNKEILKGISDSVSALFKPEHDKISAEMEKLMDKIAAKYGGKEKLKAKYGKELPPAIMDEFKAESMKAGMLLMHKQMPIQQKYVRGITFYMMLKPENDPHYAGGGVKLGTPDRPILWYKPTDADKYRVIYADLSIKEVASEELKSFPEASDP